MEPKFQSSFIPKKTLSTRPTASKRVKPTNLISAIALIIFLGAILISVGLFLYIEYLNISLTNKEEQLERARGAFEPALIKELTRLNDRIEASEQILSKHTAPSILFEFLENNTLESISFSNLLLTPVDDSRFSLLMNGEARSFSAVALQSDVFGKSDIINDPVFSNLDLDSFGNVRFNLSALVDSDFISYSNTIKNTLNTE